MDKKGICNREFRDVEVEFDRGYSIVLRFSVSGSLSVFAVFKRPGDKPNIKQFSRLR